MTSTISSRRQGSDIFCCLRSSRRLKNSVAPFSGLLENTKSKPRTRRRNEQALYEPIARYLEKGLSLYGRCEMYITKSTIPRAVKARLDKDSLFYVRGEKLNPDIMGFYEPKPSGRQWAHITPGLIIVEVKEGPVKIKDIYQVKMYSEVFGSFNTFLISGSPIPVELERFLIEHPHIRTTHAGNKQLFLASFSQQAIDEEIVTETKWSFNRSPFTPYP
jgi:hypothetical protein